MEGHPAGDSAFGGWDCYDDELEGWRAGSIPVFVI